MLLEGLVSGNDPFMALSYYMAFWWGARGGLEEYWHNYETKSLFAGGFYGYFRDEAF